MKLILSRFVLLNTLTCWVTYFSCLWFETCTGPRPWYISCGSSSVWCCSISDRCRSFPSSWDISGSQLVFPPWYLRPRRDARPPLSSAPKSSSTISSFPCRILLLSLCSKRKSAVVCHWRSRLSLYMRVLCCRFEATFVVKVRVIFQIVLVRVIRQIAAFKILTSTAYRACATLFSTC